MEPQNDQNNAPEATTPVTPQNTEQKSAGGVIGIILIVIILIVAGVYVFKNHKPAATVPTGPDQATQQLKQQGTSDTLSSIQADVSATDLNNLDAELNNIQQQLPQ